MQAARAYDGAARAIRGSSAVCNFPEEVDNVFLPAFAHMNTGASANRSKRHRPAEEARTPGAPALPSPCAAAPSGATRLRQLIDGVSPRFH